MQKKVVKVLGSILMILTIVFFAHRLGQIDLDFTDYLSWRNVIIAVILTVLFAIHMVLIGTSWWVLVERITGRKVPYLKAIYIVDKSNMMKYLPGNIFQYVGRNELAFSCNLSQADVAMATLVDTFLLFAGITLASLLAGRKLVINKLITIISDNFLIIVLAFGVVLIVSVAFFVYKIMKADYLIIRRLFNLKSVCSILLLIVFYMFWGIYTGTIFALVYGIILHQQLTYQIILILIGGFLFSWIGGYLTPGSPGGIGVRETIISLVLANVADVNTDAVIVAILIYRVINIVGDALAYLISLITIRLCKDNDYVKNYEH